jgi:hypothetical protein
MAVYGEKAKGGGALRLRLSRFHYEDYVKTITVTKIPLKLIIYITEEMRIINYL